MGCCSWVPAPPSPPEPRPAISYWPLPSVIEPEPFQNPRRMFLHASGASLRLLRPREVQQITSLSSRSERVERFGQLRVIIQARKKFRRHLEIGHALLLNLGAGFLN